MKKLLPYQLFACIIIAACSKNDKTPLVADFDSQFSGQAPNAQITITNKSSGASSYQWTFGTGASIISSTDKEPALFIIDKKGDFSITLKVFDGVDYKEVTKTINIPGNNPVITYPNLEFGINAGDINYGRYFSFETGLMYKDSEINSTNGPKIHLGFGSMDHTIFYFESPTRKDLGLMNVPNATQTKVVNWELVPTISVSAFDEMLDDRLLTGLSIIGTNESFDTSLPCTILFQISTGRNGVIKAKYVNSDRLLVDIKIQKY